MKILRVAADLYPEVVGGYGLHIHEMSKMQAQMGHDVTVFSKQTGDKPEFEERDGYKIRRFEPAAEVFGNSINLNMLTDLWNGENGYDVIHAHSHLFFPTNLSAFVRMFKDTPLIITNHGLESQTPPMWFSNLYNKTLGLWTFNRADAIISYSEEEKQKMMGLGVTSNIKVIHNGINTEQFSPLKDVEKKNQILWVGRFLPGKAVHHLLDAFSILKKEDSIPDLTLKLVGDGPLKDELMERAKVLGVHDSIILNDFVPNNKISEVYNGSKVFALSSLTEGVPRTVLEALSCGTPVVSTELPQINGIIKGCGYVVPQQDSKALADSIKKIFTDDEKREEFGKNARRKIEEGYSWRDTVERTIKLYGKVIV